MQLEPQIVFRRVPPTDAIQARVREEIAELEQFFDRIMGCRVVLEPSGKQHHQGNLYHVRIDLTVPGAEIVVRRDPPADHAHEDLYVAIRDAFAAARRRLEDHAREQRGDVKARPKPDHGEVVRIDAQQDFGFLRATDGHEVYFHRNSVTDGRFDDLTVGSWVEFVEEAGEEGPQAARLHAAHGLRPPTEVTPPASEPRPA